MLIGRLVRGGAALGGADRSSVRFVAVVLGPYGREAPTKSALATAHTVATLLRDEQFFAAALHAGCADDVRAHAEDFLHRRLAAHDSLRRASGQSGGGGGGGGGGG